MEYHTHDTKQKPIKMGWKIFEHSEVELVIAKWSMDGLFFPLSFLVLLHPVSALPRAFITSPRSNQNCFVHLAKKKPQMICLDAVDVCFCVLYQEANVVRKFEVHTIETLQIGNK